MKKSPMNVRGVPHKPFPIWIFDVNDTKKHFKRFDNIQLCAQHLTEFVGAVRQAMTKRRAIGGFYISRTDYWNEF